MLWIDFFNKRNNMKKLFILLGIISICSCSSEMVPGEGLLGLSINCVNYCGGNDNNVGSFVYNNMSHYKFICKCRNGKRTEEYSPIPIKK